jgi:hypothetical protein
MIDIGKILGRAWHVLWNYKILWIFGILLALTIGGGANGQASFNQGYRRGDGYQGGYNPENLPAFMERTSEWFETYAQPWFEQTIEPMFATHEGIVSFIVWSVVIVLAIGIVLGTLTALIRFPSEAAIMRMVDDYEQSGAKVGFKQGWKLGWNRRAFRLWAIHLIVNLPAIVFALVVLVLGIAVASSAVRGEWPSMVGTAIGLAAFVLLFGLVIWLASIFLGLLRHFFARKAVLEGTGIGDSFRLGWAMFKNNWQSAALMWLVLVGLTIAFGLVSIVLFIVLLLPMVFTFLAGLLVAAIPAGLAYWIASLTSIEPIAWIVALLVGMPFLLLVTFSPWILITGWVEVFKSSIWTLTYREIKALENVKPAAAKPAKA